MLKSSGENLIMVFPLSVLHLFCTKKTIHLLFSPDFSKNYQKFFRFERFSDFCNINLQFGCLIFLIYSMFFLFYSCNFRLKVKINIFFQQIKPIKKKAASRHKLEKLASNLKMNITKMRVLPIFITFFFKLNANFPSLHPKSAHFFDFVNFCGFICQKNTSILALGREVNEQNISAVSSEN